MGTGQVSEQSDGAVTRIVDIASTLREKKMVFGFLMFEVVLLILSIAFSWAAPANMTGEESYLALISSLLLAGVLVTALVWGPFIVGYEVYIWIKKRKAKRRRRSQSL